MKQIFFAAAILLMGTTTSFAQADNAGAAPASQKSDAAIIQFDKMEHDFGTIPQGVPASHTFVVKNTGKMPLIISSATASCGCTTPDYTKEPILPGKKGFVKATFNAATAGPFNKNITVVSNADKSTVVLVIKGEVKANETTPATPASAH